MYVQRMTVIDYAFLTYILGDSGGALVCYENNDAVHVGVNSFGYQCGKDGVSI